MAPISEKTKIRIQKESQSWLAYHGSAAVEEVVNNYPRVCPKFIRKHAAKMRGIHDFPAEIERFNRFNWCLKS
jgi:tRNA G18 (ribose-2'-O)-methylase SpoU